MTSFEAWVARLLILAVPASPVLARVVGNEVPPVSRSGLRGDEVRGDEVPPVSMSAGVVGEVEGSPEVPTEVPPASTGVSRGELVELPDVPLEDLRPAAREQLVEQLRVVRELVATERPDPRELAEAMGDLGKIYYLYGFDGLAGIAWHNATLLAADDYRWHYYLGVVRHVEGELDAAVASLERVLELRPGYTPARLRLGRIRLAQGRLEESADLFAKVLVAQPDSAAALYGLGRIAVAQERYDEAVDLLERALASQPPGTVVHHQLGLAFRGLGDLERAREQLAQSAGVDVSFPDPLMERLASLVEGAHFLARTGIDALRRGEPGTAVDWLRRAATVDPSSAWIHYNLGVALAAAGRPREAAEVYRRAIEVDPSYSDAHYNLGMILVDEERIAEAAQHFRSAHEIDPNDHVAHLELAVALSHLGEHEAALAELDALIESAPRLARARLARATLLAQLGRLDEARAAAARAASMDATAEDLAAAEILLARLLESERAGEAESHYRRALAHDPESEEARYRLALLLGRQGRFRAASTELGRLVEAHPDEPDYRMGQAMALLLAEDYDAALAALEAAHRALPTRLDLADALARLLATCPDAAIRDGERALDLARQVMAAQQTLDHAETLAMALAEHGDFEQAAALQRQVLEQLTGRAAGGRLASARSRLDLYRRNEAVRAPWRETPGP